MIEYRFLSLDQILILFCYAPMNDGLPMIRRSESNKRIASSRITGGALRKFCLTINWQIFFRNWEYHKKKFTHPSVIKNFTEIHLINRLRVP